MATSNGRRVGVLVHAARPNGFCRAASGAGGATRDLDLDAFLVGVAAAGSLAAVRRALSIANAPRTVDRKG